MSSQKRPCHVPYSTTHVCVAFTACADASAVSAPSRDFPTERCVQDPSRILVEAHVLVAVAARRLRVRKHSVPLSSDRGSAAATVTRPSRRVPSTVPPCPASPTPPLDRIGVGSTPATIYPRALAQHFSCQWRCNRPDVLLLQTALQQPAPW